jgi:polyhydroxyalkanoate synthase subunit PhaC
MIKAKRAKMSKDIPTPDSDNADYENTAEILQENFKKMESLSARLMSIMGKNSQKMADILPNQELMAKAMTAYFTDMMANPAKLIEMQVGYWKSAVEQFSHTENENGSGGKKDKDRRFSNDQWESNPFFTYMKDQYLLMSDAAKKTTENMVGLPDKDRERLKFYTQQFSDMMAPGNFLATNPDALAKAIETNGQSLVKGLENLVRDLEANDGKYAVSLTDSAAFKVGENVASTPGKVVFQNRMFQLIQYAPAGETVYEIPLLVIPPWINKFYILDLHEGRSLMEFAVAQGQNVFVLSWVNPDASYADNEFDDYAFEGMLTALVQVIKISESEKVNALAFCIGGTLLTCTLAWLAKKGMSPIQSATFLTTLVDFESPGELGLLVNEESMRSIEADAKRTGVLEAFKLNQTFSYLRSKDLVYGPAIKSYMMGEAPPAFDLLYWNQDTPHLPAAMAVNYLRDFYMNNLLVKGEYNFGGEALDLQDVDLPFYSVAARTDHIVPWEASFTGVNKLGSKNAKFVLTGSGHIAGVVNPPAANKYGYSTNPDRPDDLNTWLAGADDHEGSWWTDWAKWISARSGVKIPAKAPGGPDHPPLEDAPGSYVVKKTTI